MKKNYTGGLRKIFKKIEQYFIVQNDFVGSKMHTWPSFENFIID